MVFLYTPSKYLTEDRPQKQFPGALVISFVKVNRQNSTPRFGDTSIFPRLFPLKTLLCMPDGLTTKWQVVHVTRDGNLERIIKYVYTQNRWFSDTFREVGKIRHSIDTISNFSTNSKILIRRENSIRIVRIKIYVSEDETPTPHPHVHVEQAKTIWS